MGKQANQYYIMLARKYQLPVQQYVFFLGTGMPRMAVQYQSDWMQYRFRLVAFHTLDYRIFLNSDRPEEVLLSVLGDFKEEKLETVLEEIVERVKQTTEGDFQLKRYYNQLRVLAQLRNLEKKLKEFTMDDLSNFVSVERDALYMIGEEIAQVKFITNLLKLNQFTVEEIAALGDVSVELVEKVKAKLAAGTSPAGGE
ncbi:hypothetical protein ACO2Q8_25290 [Larkinella sp. VNQ87]|uniref:hypothetical protein n=1 Tax=Larkinella sp. VNQ87 TaxID=3400921 RepID=UPI003BFF99B8